MTIEQTSLSNCSKEIQDWITTLSEQPTDVFNQQSKVLTNVLDFSEHNKRPRMICDENGLRYLLTFHDHEWYLFINNTPEIFVLKTTDSFNLLLAAVRSEFNDDWQHLPTPLECACYQNNLFRDITIEEDFLQFLTDEKFTAPEPTSTCWSRFLSFFTKQPRRDYKQLPLLANDFIDESVELEKITKELGVN